MAMIDGVATNLKENEFREVLAAIDSEAATCVPGSASVFAESAGCQFDYKGERYEFEESFETPVTLAKVKPGAPAGATGLLMLLADDLS